MKFPPLEELIKEKPRRGPITAILKRDSDIPESFDLSKISSAVKKASFASGEDYSEEKADSLASEVMVNLRMKETYEHSGRAIPNVEDIQDEVINVLTQRNASRLSESISSKIDVSSEILHPIILEELKTKGELDPTPAFYTQYRAVRDEVRKRLVDIPFNVEFDSTDRQLQIHNVEGNGNSHKFDAERLTTLILERTSVNYGDAQSAVKRVSDFLAHRKTNGTIGKDEIVAIIDAALMEKGYPKSQTLGGKNLSITFDDVNQLIYKRSVENSNIKVNNPEAVNLGIAELVLKELALREVFGEDVAKAHRLGTVHIHDLGYVDRVYCSAHSIEYLKKYGLDVVVANLDAKSSPPKDPTVLNNHLHTFLAAIQSSYAGALGFPMLNTLYGPALLKEVEMIEGFEIKKDIDGNVTEKIPKRLRKETLEGRIEDGDLKTEDFEIINSLKIIDVYSKKEMKQIAQNLVFGASQSAFSRGGQTLFIDFNIDTVTPEYVTEVPAIFLGGKYKRVTKNDKGEWVVVEVNNQEPSRHQNLKGKETNKNGDVIQPEDETRWVTYGHELVRNASRDFAYALLDVAADGDKHGNMFNFPKFDVHVGRETFEDPDADKLLRRACEVVEKNDSVYFLYDRGDGMNVAQCCRLRERITDPELLKHPEKMRFCGFQNISINLPQAGFSAKGNNLEERLSSTLENIDNAMLIALRAHMDKRTYIQKLLDTDGTPMRSMGLPSDDGLPYIDLNKSTYIIGIVGLNELVQTLSGKQMDEDAEAYKIGLGIISHMYSVKSEFTKRYGMKFVIEETPGESANRRLAKIDLLRFPDEAKKVLKGSLEDDEIYYTNSSHLRADAPLSGIDRAVLQGMTNPMIEAGAITHIFSGERANKSAAVYDFVKGIYEKTQSSQLVFSGEHTVCLKCGAHNRGLKQSCPNCGNDDFSQISQKTRVVGYFSDPRTWNKSKIGELKLRKEAQEFYAGQEDSLRDLESELVSSINGDGKIRIGVIGKKGCSICDTALERVERFAGKYISDEFKDKIEIVKYDVENETDRVPIAIYHSPIDSYPTVVMHRGDRFVKKGWEYPYNKPAVDVNTGDLKNMFSELINYEK